MTFNEEIQELINNANNNKWDNDTKESFLFLSEVYSDLIDSSSSLEEEEALIENLKAIYEILQ